jgi:hypothetical protein
MVRVVSAATLLVFIVSLLPALARTAPPFERIDGCSLSDRKLGNELAL